MRLDQTTTNLTCGDLEIPLVVIRLGVTRLRKARLLYLLDLFGGRVEKGCCDLVCVERLSVIEAMVFLLMSRMVSMALV